MTARAQLRRHRLWAILGVSPAAIPFLLAMWTLGVAGVGAICVGVSLAQADRAVAASRTVARLAARAVELRDEPS